MGTTGSRPQPPTSITGLSVVGWDHRRTPLALLERVSLSRHERPALLGAVGAAGGTDVVVLSTCSRTEVYSGPAGPAPDALLEVLARHLRVSVHEMAATSRRRTGLDVVEHLFRVTSGLESRLVGEVDIRSQVRGAVREARLAGLTVPAVGPLFAAAVRCAHRVGELTTLGGQATSLGRRAVDVGLARTSRVDEPVVLVVGAGRMARTAVERLREHGRRPRVAARSELHASRLAGARSVCPLPALAAGVAEADLLICATSASHDVVTLDLVRRAMRGRSRPLTVIDLSVPRNVDTTVSALPGVLLLDVEDLHQDAGRDRELARDVEAGGAVVQAEVSRYADSLAARSAGAVIAAVRDSVEQTCLRELTRVAAGQVETEVLVRAAHSIAGKLLHQPTLTARAAAVAGDERLLGVLGDLFCEGASGSSVASTT